MPRQSWKCPGCNRILVVRDATDMVLCPECSVPPVSPVKKKKQPKSTAWTASDIAFAVVSCAVLLTVIGIGAVWFFKAIPETDPDKLLVHKWLKDNLEDGKWDEVKWFPANTPEGLYNLNLLHVVEGTEEAKSAYEKGLADVSRDACIQLHDNIRKTGVRRFCAMSFRTSTLSGVGKNLHKRVFEIVDGEAKPLLGNLIVELQSSPSMKNRPHNTGSYDGWRYFEEKGFDPFQYEIPSDLEERFKAALIWKEPVKKEPAPAPVVAVAAPVTPHPVVAKKQADEPQPLDPRVRDYFKRMEAAKDEDIKAVQKRKDELAVTLRRVRVQGPVREKMRQADAEIAQLNKLQGIGLLPERPEVGDIGSFRMAKVTKIIDDETLLVRWSMPNKGGKVTLVDVVIQPLKARKYEIGDESLQTGLYKVTGTSFEQSDLLKKLGDAGVQATLVVTPLESEVVEIWRGMYERESRKR